MDISNHIETEQHVIDAIVKRINNAKQQFIDTCIEKGFTRDEAEHIFDVYRRERIITLDMVNGRYTIKHGVFWNTCVMRNALTLKRKGDDHDRL